MNTRVEMENCLSYLKDCVKGNQMNSVIKHLHSILCHLSTKEMRDEQFELYDSLIELTKDFNHKEYTECKYHASCKEVDEEELTKNCPCLFNLIRLLRIEMIRDDLNKFMEFYEEDSDDEYAG